MLKSEALLAFGARLPLQAARDVFVLAACVCVGLFHLDVPSSELPRVFIFGLLHALHIFGVANKIWIRLIDIGRAVVVDERTLS